MQILGISFDTVQDNDEFAERFYFKFPLLCDPDRTVGLAYGACDVQSEDFPRRMTFVIGADGKIERVYDVIDVRTHVDKVLRDLKRKQHS